MKQELDKDATGRGGILLGQQDDTEDGPRDDVGVEEVTEELANVPDLVGFQAMNSVVHFVEAAFKIFLPNGIKLAEAFSKQAVEL